MKYGCARSSASLHIMAAHAAPCLWIRPAPHVPWTNADSALLDVIAFPALDSHVECSCQCLRFPALRESAPSLLLEGPAIERRNSHPEGCMNRTSDAMQWPKTATTAKSSQPLRISRPQLLRPTHGSRGYSAMCALCVRARASRRMHEQINRAPCNGQRLGERRKVRSR